MLDISFKIYLRRSEDSPNDYESSPNDYHSEEERPSIRWPNVIVRPYAEAQVEQLDGDDISHPPARRRQVLYYDTMVAFDTGNKHNCRILQLL